MKSACNLQLATFLDGRLLLEKTWERILGVAWALVLMSQLVKGKHKNMSHGWTRRWKRD